MGRSGREPQIGPSMTVQMRAKTVLLLVLGGALTMPCLADDQLYAVQKGDTLSAIARRYHLSTKSLAQWNALSDVNDLKTGSRLYIPEEDSRLIKYVVQKGDSLANIAYEHGQTLGRVARLNKLPEPEHIFPGQTLLVPQDGSKSTITPQLAYALDQAGVKQGRWKNIVIHHSGSTKDNPSIMDNYHRRVRKMENGLAYHFVIGGSGPRMDDGEMFIGNRWKQQLQGGHVASADLNDESIGICLVGNFNNAPPTRKQMRALADLIGYLMERCGLSADDVYTHVGINPKPTQCPGRKFSLTDLKKLLQY